MMCLTRNGTNDVFVQPCDADDIMQSWSYLETNGQIATPTTDINTAAQLCLLCSSNANGVACNKVGDCSLGGTRFVQYSECRLNTYTSTVELKVEAIDEPGQCIPGGSQKGALLNLVGCSTSDAGSYQYFYDPFESRLELTNSDFCFGKAGPLFGDERELFEYPTGLTNCGNLSNNEEKVFWLTSLGGENYNVLQWQQPFGNNTDNNTNVNTLAQTTRFVPDWYCYSIPQYLQQKCDKDTGLYVDTGVNAPRWKQFGSTNDDTAVSVRPELLLQEITDPDLL
jgi:hypothetical protein